MRPELVVLLLQLWGSVKVSSSLKACEKLPDVPNATVTDGSKKAEYVGGNVIYFACKTGYISGPTIRYVCTDTGWDAIYAGRCFLKPCPLPDDTLNGYYQLITGDEFVFGSTVKYFCNEGYQMVSKVDIRTCLLNQWTNHVPVCDPLSCELPPVGEETVTGLPYNDGRILPNRFLRFSCEVPGKYLNGSALLTCGVDGRWDHPFPTCEDITCDLSGLTAPVRAVGLSPANTTVTAGQKQKFECDDEYVLTGSNEVTCLETGQWNAPLPTCNEKCRVVGVPDGVRTSRNGEQLQPGQKVRFYCRTTSQHLWGEKEIECLQSGHWSHPFPTCGAPSNCESPPMVEDADITQSLKSSYRHEEEVFYRCQNYYILEGQDYKKCYNGRWTGAMRCLKPCTVDRQAMNLHNIRFKHVSDDKLYATHNDHITFSCTRGRQVGQIAMRQRCVEGEMLLPSCQ